MTGHTAAIVAAGTQAWVAHCVCGWVSPRVSDRRTADQAHQEHARATRGAKP